MNRAIPSNSSSNYSSSNSFSQGSTELQPPPFKLVKRLNWPKLAVMMEKKRNHKSCMERDETGLTLLGISLGYHAPLEIIKLIISLDPEQLTAIDMFGANSLHQACLNGNPPTVISYLLEQRRDLASSRDKDMRTPLHHIVECICRDEVHLSEGLKVINVLCRCNCAMIHSQDIMGNSPLDVVHIARCGKGVTPFEKDRLEKTTKFLRRVSFKFYRLKKQCWEDKIPLEIGKTSSGSKSFITSSTNSSSVWSRFRGEQTESMGRFLREDEYDDLM